MPLNPSAARELRIATVENEQAYRALMPLMLLMRSVPYENNGEGEDNGTAAATRD